MSHDDRLHIIRALATLALQDQRAQDYEAVGRSVQLIHDLF